MGSVGAGTCNSWSTRFLFASMLPCPRIPEHLMQVPDLIDLVLTVLLGGGEVAHPPNGCANEHSREQFAVSHTGKIWHELWGNVSCDNCPLASGAKFPFFGLLFARPETFFRAPDFVFFCFFCGLGWIWSPFLCPRKYLSAWNSGAWKGIGGGNFGQSRPEDDKRHQNWLERAGHVPSCSFQHCLREFAGFMVWIAMQFPLQQLADWARKPGTSLEKTGGTAETGRQNVHPKKGQSQHYGSYTPEFPSDLGFPSINKEDRSECKDETTRSMYWFSGYALNVPCFGN